MWKQTRQADKLTVVTYEIACRKCGSQDMVRYGFDYSSIAKGTVKQIFRCKRCGTCGSASKGRRGFGMKYPDAVITRALSLMRMHPTERAGEILGVNGRTLRKWREMFS